MFAVIQIFLFEAIRNVLDFIAVDDRWTSQLVEKICQKSLKRDTIRLLCKKKKKK